MPHIVFIFISCLIYFLTSVDNNHCQLIKAELDIVFDQNLNILPNNSVGIINIKQDSTEICNNELDDDCDGLIDTFDPNCACHPDLYQAQCPIECQYVPDSFPSYQMRTKWISEEFNAPNAIVNIPNIVVGDVDGDQIQDILTFKSFTGDSGVVILDANTGATKYEFNTSMPLRSSYMMSIADIDRDGTAEIFISNEWSFTSTFIQCYSPTGNLLWTSEDLLPYFDGIAGTPSILNVADFNADGASEVYLGHVILNAATGVTLAVGNQGKGCNQYNAIGCYNLVSVAADVLPSPGLELVAGNTVYEVSLNNLNGTTGNSLHPIEAPSEIRDGFSGVADFDGDQLLDIVCISTNTNGTNTHGISIWNPRTQQIMASTASGDGGSMPFIGDVDGDCRPELGVLFNNELIMYDFDGSNQLQLKYSRIIFDVPGLTGITMFDFNQDGRQEIVYRDQDWLRIYDGAEGFTLDSILLNSRTGNEYPIIVDIDNDNQAEILVSGYNTEVYCIESGDQPWAPARSVWNQMCYNVTNINDDLSVPRNPQNTAQVIPGTDNCAQETCPQVYNSFLTQATFRTQEGCVQWAAADLVSNIADIQCQQDSLVISIEINNLGDSPISEDCIYLSYYLDSLSNNVESTWIICPTMDLVADTLIFPYTVDITISVPNGNPFLYFNVNDPGSGANQDNYVTTQILECNYSNNLDSMLYQYPEHILDLPDSLFICLEDSISINAGEGFLSYNWNNASTDSIIIASNPGVYIVTTTDICDNTYTDSTVLALYPMQEVLFSGPSSHCIGDSITLNVSNSYYNSIRWTPVNVVSCDTCFTTNVSVTSASYVVASLSSAECETMDSVWIAVDEPIDYYYSSDICEGDSLWFFDQYVHTANNYSFESALCDTIFHLELNVRINSYMELDTSICNGDSILFGGQYYLASGDYTDSLQNVYGCDSIINLHLSTIDIPSTIIDTIICPTDSIQIENNWFAEQGSYDMTLTSSSGCDSILQIQIAHYPIYDIQLQDYICEGDSIGFGDSFYSTAGNYLLELETVHGCDSIINLDLSIVEIVTDTIYAGICPGDSIQLWNDWYSEADTYELMFSGVEGCDSLIVLHFNELTSYTQVIDSSICNHDTLWYNDASYTAEGTYEFQMSTSDGCDSTIILNLSHWPSYHDTILYSFCQDDSIFINNQYYHTEGNYELVLNTINGCDSILSLVITEEAPIINSQQFSICQGDSIEIFDEWIFNTGIYQDTFVAANNCDSIVSIQLTVDEILRDTIRYEICDGDSILINSNWYYTEQVFESILNSTDACDTLQVHDISIKDLSEVYRDTFICPGDSIFIDQFIYGPTTVSTISTGVNSCDSVTYYDVQYYYQPIDLNLNDISLELGRDTSISINIDTSEWMISWTPSQYIDCDTCSSINLSADQNTRINLSLTHSSGCSYYDSFLINIEYEADPVIPNIFSPNNDGVNDIWSVDLSDFTASSLYIYDRWGNLIHHLINEPILQWDGYFKGKKAAQGVYVYVVEFIDLRGRKRQIPGDVTLIR